MRKLKAQRLVNLLKISVCVTTLTLKVHALNHYTDLQWYIIYWQTFKRGPCVQSAFGSWYFLLAHLKFHLTLHFPYPGWRALWTLIPSPSWSVLSSSSCQIVSIWFQLWLPVLRLHSPTVSHMMTCCVHSFFQFLLLSSQPPSRLGFYFCLRSGSLNQFICLCTRNTFSLPTN